MADPTAAVPVQGLGVAGTPAGLVVSVQGVSGGTSIPVTGASDVAPSTINITAQDVGSTTTAQSNSQNAITGTPTASSFASFALSSSATVEVQVTGTWTGTLSSEVSMDGGTTWFTRGLKQTGASYISTTFTADFEGVLNVAAITNYRVRSTATWTGTATVKVVESTNLGSLIISNPLTLRDVTTQSIGNSIKAASTLAANTDTAIVVTPRPGDLHSSNITQISGATPSASNALPSQISVGGSFVSGSNPFPVTIDPAAAGTPKNYPTDSSSITAGSSATQNTTVGGTTGFYLQQVSFSSRGQCKAVISIETGVATNVFTPTFYGFNSAAFPTVIIPVPNNTLIATGVRVQALLTNEEITNTMDLYSTVSGFQV
jgi:hypothetical protein